MRRADLSPLADGAHFDCIVCGRLTVEEFLDLGKTPLANKFLKADEIAHSTEPVYPLKVGFCHTCGHVQLTERISPRLMFEDYLYMSSTSETLTNHLCELSAAIVKRCHLESQELVIDIGCNDGTLLSFFRRHGVRVLGVDPASNLAELTRHHGIDRYVGFFTASSAREIVKRWGRAAAITATNTFPHIPDLRDFIEGIRTALAERGTFVVEAHYLVDLLEQKAFDTVYHEHVSYWALGPMMYLLNEAGMDVVHVERLPIHHGQIRVFVQRKGEGQADSSVGRLLALEASLGIGRIDTYRQFSRETQRIKSEIHAKLNELHAAGKTLAGYGAPAKGNTLLNFLEIGPDILAYIADKSPLKQGLYSPGLHIPVVPPERVLIDQPDYLLLLAWNFADEILQQQAEYKTRGGQFIVPLPQVRVI